MIVTTQSILHILKQNYFPGYSFSGCFSFKNFLCAQRQNFIMLLHLSLLSFNLNCCLKIYLSHTTINSIVIFKKEGSEYE